MLTGLESKGVCMRERAVPQLLLAQRQFLKAP